MSCLPAGVCSLFNKPLGFDHPCDPLYEGEEECVAFTPPVEDAGSHDDVRPAGPGLVCLDAQDHQLLPGWCLIDEEYCASEGDISQHNSCHHCAPEDIGHHWSRRPDGSTCSAPASTTGEGADGAGAVAREGHCQEGVCLALDDGCTCAGERFCCDGCHPIDEGEVCRDDDLACTEYQCSVDGQCVIDVLPGWCLVEEDDCRNLDSEPDNFGECGHQCEEGEVCLDGGCTLRCDSGLVACAGECVDLDSNAAHCGACGNGCQPDEECVASRCLAQCAWETTRCGEVCVDLQTSTENCGECGNGCGEGGHCEAGRCRYPVLGIGVAPSTLTATVLPSYATDRSITWSSSDPEVVRVDQQGLVTGKSFGNAFVTATSAEGGKVGTSTVFVRIPASGVVLAPSGMTLYEGESGQLQAGVSPDDATIRTLTLSSSNPLVAGVDSSGRVWAHSVGTATIRATSDQSGVWGSALVSVRIPVTGVSVSLSSLMFTTGSSHTFSSCGATGRSGPGLAHCTGSYAPSWADYRLYFDVVEGIQRFMVPATGAYRIEARGAQGGGHGAVVITRL